jgi:hypothetical protein
MVPLGKVVQAKCQSLNKLAWDESGSAKAYLGSGGALSAEIPLQRVDGRVKNQMAVGTSFQMALDLAFDGRRKSAL